MKRLEEYPPKVLCEIYEKLNSWEWDERCGEEPEGWGEMPKYNRHWYHKLIKRKTKTDYIEPVLSFIRTLVPEKELLRFHNVEVLNIPTETFEQWWSINYKFQSSSWQ